MTTAADVKMKYATFLAQRDRMPEAISELERSIGLYRILLKHPDAPPEATEKMLQVGFTLFSRSILQNVEKGVLNHENQCLFEFAFVRRRCNRRRYAVAKKEGFKRRSR